jgi:hypothetical protein
VIGVAVFKQWPSEKLLWMLAWAWVPVAAIFVFSHLFFSIWNTRYVMLVLPYILILLAIGFTEIWSWRSKVAWVIALIYVIAVGSGLFYYYTTPKRYMGGSDHYRSIAQLINSQVRSSDSIVWSIIHGTALPLKHYYRGSAPIYVKTLIGKNQADIQKADTENWVRGLPSTDSRLWIVYGQKNPYIREVLEKNFAVKIEQNFGGVSVFLVVPQSQRLDSQS